MILRMSQLGFQSALRCVHQLSNFILHYYNTKASHSQVPNIFALSPMFGPTISPTSSHALSFPFHQSKILAILGMLYSQYHDRDTGQPPKFSYYIMLFCTSAPLLMNLQLSGSSFSLSSQRKALFVLRFNSCATSFLIIPHSQPNLTPSRYNLQTFFCVTTALVYITAIYLPDTLIGSPPCQDEATQLEVGTVSYVFLNVSLLLALNMGYSRDIH